MYPAWSNILLYGLYILVPLLIIAMFVIGNYLNKRTSSKMQKLASELGLKYQSSIKEANAIKYFDISGEYKRKQVEIYCAFAPTAYLYVYINNKQVLIKELKGSFNDPLRAGPSMVYDVDTEEIKRILESN